MNADLWRRAQDVFERALRRSAEERQPFVAEACAADGELRRAVETLLAADALPVHPLESPPVTAMQRIVATGEDRPWIGRTLGAYRVVDKLGEGGMGSVFVAERSDEEFEKRVAVKVLRSGWTSEQALLRFRRERQIVARLEHPNIARLVDGGTTPEGLPYLVMELVDGRPITDYCDGERLGVDRRIDLMRTVCAAVRYAHQNLVVHRDLKANNILVSSDGVPKLLDFGVAKLLDDDDVPASSTRVLTPGYASPEQVGGGAITTASDVYSLGVVLYELLTGRVPFPRSGVLPTEGTETRLPQQEAIPPSAALVSTEPSGPQPLLALETVAGARRSSADALPAKLRGDLDNITLRALRQDPQRRYGSAEELSEDLRRYREGLPVQARPASLGYRAAKFIRRHRQAVGAVAVAALSLIGLAVYATVSSARLARERDATLRQQQEAEQLAQLLVNAFRFADPSQDLGRHLSAREIVDFGAKRVRLGLAEQPRVRARLLTTLGEVYTSLGEYDSAEPLLDEALAIVGDMGDRGAAPPLYQKALLEYRKGDYPQAETTARTLLAIPPDSDPTTIRKTRHLLARIVNAQDRSAEAIALHREALEAFEASGEAPDDVYIEGLRGLAFVYQVAVRYEESESLLDRALAAQAARHPGPHPLTAQMLRTKTVLMRRVHRYREAETAGLAALEMMDRLYGEEHPSTAEALGTLGTVYRRMRDLERAEAFQRRSLESLLRSLGADHPRTTTVRYNLALMLQHEMGRSQEAEALVTEALHHLRAKLGSEHNRIGFYSTLLGDALVSQGRAAEALPPLEEALALFRKGADDPARNSNVAMVESSLGNAYLTMGRLTEARELLERAQRVLDGVRGPQYIISRRCAERRLALYRALGDETAAAGVLPRLDPASAKG